MNELPQISVDVKLIIMNFILKYLFKFNFNN